MSVYRGIGVHKIYQKLPLDCAKKIRWQYPNEQWQEIEGDRYSITPLNPGYNINRQYVVLWKAKLREYPYQWGGPLWQESETSYSAIFTGRFLSIQYWYPGEPSWYMVLNQGLRANLTWYGYAGLGMAVYYLNNNGTNIVSTNGTNPNYDHVLQWSPYANGGWKEGSAPYDVFLARYDGQPLEDSDYEGFEFKIFDINNQVIHSETRATQPDVLIDNSCTYPLTWKQIEEVELFKTLDTITIEDYIDSFNRKCVSIHVYRFNGFAYSDTLLLSTCSPVGCDCYPLYIAELDSTRKCPENTCEQDCGDIICCYNDNGDVVMIFEKGGNVYTFN